MITVVVALAMVPQAAAAESEPKPLDDPGPVVSRIAGADRYDLAAKLALETSPAGADIVYVASGANFPDALSAGPAAVHRAAPLLLVQPTALPAQAAAALTTLDPRTVIVVGGSASIDDTVVRQIGAAAPRATVSRVYGSDRYAGSRAVIRDAYSGLVPSAFIATGRSFPDALAAGSVAGSSHMPILLIDGALPGVDIPTESFLHSLRTASTVLIGGTSSISAEAEFALKLTHSVERIAGSDRYLVSQAVNARALQDYSVAYLVTGDTFPDALAGGVLAGSRNAPLFVVPRDCVPKGVLAQLDDNAASRVVLLGGAASLSSAVEAMRPCSW